MKFVVAAVGLIGFLSMGCPQVTSPDFKVLGVDVTESYRGYWDVFLPDMEENDIRFDEYYNELAKVRYLFVPGFLSDVVIDSNILPGMEVTKLGEYFDRQIKWMKEIGFAAERVEVESEGSIEDNAEKIALAIKKSDMPVVIIAHSKGGVDTLETLIREPGLRDRVKGFLPIQSPFFGTPIANDVDEDKILNPIAKKLLKHLGGTIEAVKGLRTDTRAQYMDENQGEIRRILETIPTVSFVSHIDDKPWDWDTLLEPVRDWIFKQYGLKNDGVVPWKSAVLSGSQYVKLSEVDHAVPVMECTFIEFDRIRFLKALLVLMRQGPHSDK